MQHNLYEHFIFRHFIHLLHTCPTEAAHPVWISGFFLCCRCYFLFYRLQAISDKKRVQTHRKLKAEKRFLRREHTVSLRHQATVHGPGHRFRGICGNRIAVVVFPDRYAARRGVAAMIVCVPIQDREELLAGDRIICAERTVVVAQHNLLRRRQRIASLYHSPSATSANAIA